MARGMNVQNMMLAAEVSPGVAETSDFKRLNALRFSHMDEVDAEQIRGQGIKTATGVEVRKQHTTFGVEGLNDFNALKAVLDSVLCKPVVDQPDAGNAPTAYRHRYSPAARATDTRQSYTALWGDTTEMVRAAHAIFNSWTLGIRRGGLEFGTSMIARKSEYGVTPLGNEKQTLTVTGAPTGGAWTFTFDGKSVTGLAFDITASALQTALDTAYGTGQFVVTGGPHPATPIVVEFAGRYAFFDQPMITLANTYTGGTTPSIAATETVKGATEVATVNVPTSAFDIYADDAWDDLGTSKLLAAYEGRVALADKFVPDWTINSANTSFNTVVEQETQDRTGRLLLGFDATARAYIATFEAQARKFFRFVVTGPTIGGAVAYKLTVDWVAQILRPTDTGAFESVVTKAFDLVNTYDPVSGRFLEVELVNTVQEI